MFSLTPTENQANGIVQVHRGPWDAETRKHPAMKWLEDYTVNCIDSRAFDQPHSVWHSDDFSLLKTDGTEIKGAKEAWANTAEIFAPFTSHLHQPFYLCCTETKYGYEMLGQAWVFANFPGAASAGEKKHKDAHGKEWDMKVRWKWSPIYELQIDLLRTRSQAAFTSNS